MEFNEIISYITSPDLQERLLVLKIIFGLISFFLLGAILLFLFRTQYLQMSFLQDWREFLTYRAYGTKKMAKIWKGIRKRLEGIQESEYKLAIIEADELLDGVLKKMGFAGETVRDKIDKVTPDILPSLERLKEARKVRDNILYDPDFRLSLEQAEKTLDVYEQAFQDLEAL